MALPGKPFKLTPKGCSDTVDGSSAKPGAMTQLSDLIPNPSTDDTWIPRPAAVSLTVFPGVNTPAFVSAMLVVGDICYGMIASAKFAGKDEPFAYNILLNTFKTITGVLNANTPTSPATSGDWVPPIMAVVGTKIVVTHPGFAGGGPGFFFGWLDISGFSDATHTGTTNNTTTIGTLSANVLQAGWQVGMTIAGTNIPAGTTIVSIAVGGLSLIMSAAATDAVAGKTLTVAGGTPASPLWAAGNTNGNNLTAVPVSVSQMAGRAYFAVGNGATFSDSGNATQVTNATQALLFQNGLATTALGALPLSSPITGGIIQAIVAFQGVTAMQIIAGDASISVPNAGALSVNLLKAGTGTLSPLSIVSFNDGLAFISPEGLRAISFDAQVTNPIGDHGTGVAIPFIFAISPSRICAAANADTLRISVQNNFAIGQPQQEWWFDLTRKAWSGPHSFPADLIQPWEATFIVSGKGILANLWQSDTTVSASSVFTENSVVMNWAYVTSLLPDNESMSMNAVVESTIAANLPPGGQMSVVVLDENGAVLDTVNMSGAAAATTLWNAFSWGAAPWGGGSGVFRQRQIQWNQPLVFKQAVISITGTSQTGLIIGNLYMRHQELGYLVELPSP